MSLYRWECNDCRKHGRWLKDPGVAAYYGEQHEDRTSSARSESYNGHRTYIADDDNRRHGPCT